MALEAGRAWRVPVTLDAEAMHKAAQCLVGRHDFTTFRSAHCQSESPGKTLDRLDVRRDGDAILFEVAARLPATMRLRGGTGKWLMKRALRRYLPDEILHRPKMGFVTPISAWFRGPLAGEAAAIARSPALAELGWFDQAAIARLAADHRAGKSDHGRLLWQLLMLDKSLQRLFGLGTSSGYMAAAK